MSERHDDEHLYSHVYGGNGSQISATDVNYNNSESGLNSTNVQEAIDELAALSGLEIEVENESVIFSNV